MSNRFSLSGGSGSAPASSPAPRFALSGNGGGGGGVVSSASPAGTKQSSVRIAHVGSSSGRGGQSSVSGGAPQRNANEGRYVPAHLRQQQGQARPGSGYGARGGGYGDRGGGYGKGGGSYADRGGGYGKGGGGFGDRGDGYDRGGYGGYNDRGPPQRGYAEYDQGRGRPGAPGPRPQFGRAPAYSEAQQQPQQQQAAPAWPGLDGLPDFDDHVAADEDAFIQRFGVPKSAGIDFSRYDDIEVAIEDKFEGKKPLPPPVKTFAECNLGKVLSRNLGFNKYEVPTPVQQHCVVISTQGERDIMACAQTGSGKTLAFTLPICWHLLKHGPPRPSPTRQSTISALVLAPTRELASQIHDEASKFSFRSGLSMCVAYGGAPIDQQLRNLARGCDILVATPGRLVDLLERRALTLRNVQFLVLDEADRMLDMGFEPAMRRIIQQTDMPNGAQGRRTLMFSATFPRAIQNLANDFMHEPVMVTVGKVGAASGNVLQVTMQVEDADKPHALRDLLKANPGLTIVFTETKRNADMLEHYLNDAGFPATSIHGDRSQQERESALAAFKKGTTPILVATNVAARGLDIDNVAHVVNYDLPKDIDDYVHRIGRTGRAGNKGMSTSFVNDFNLRIAKELVLVLNEAGQDVPKFLKSMAARGPTPHGGISMAKSRTPSDREIDNFGKENEPAPVIGGQMNKVFGAPPGDDEDSMW